jgi:hypothetical protein
VADNGGFFSFSVCPDDRFPSGAFDDLSTVAISNFEVVQSTGATGGPRSPGAPSASGGGDQYIPFGATATLAGSVTTTGPTPTVQWKMYSGPGTVTFGNPAKAATTASFNLPGDYILMLSASDGIHAIAYDAVTIHVVLAASGNASGSDFIVQFPTLSGRTYRLEQSADLAAGSWTTTVDNITGTGGVKLITVSGALSQPKRYYHVVVLP